METLHIPGDIVANRYRIVASLSQGGNGTTYVAEALTNDELVVIKAVSLRQMADWKVLELLEREAKVLASLDHLSIPKYLEYFHIDSDRDRCFYLVQQLARGDSLADLVRQGWHTDEVIVQDIAFQVLKILDYLHRRTPAIIHRDIQPRHLIRWADGQVFLVDFGSVRDIACMPQSYSSTFVGTDGYMPPEQLKGKTCFASDLYSLGATLLFVLTGRSPDELPQKGMKIDFRCCVQLSPNFANWLEKMLEPSVKARFQSAQEALTALRSKRRHVQSSAQQSSIARQSLPPVKRTTTPSHKSPRKQQPAGSRVILRRTDAWLVIEVPPAGFGGTLNLVAIAGCRRLEINSQWFHISWKCLGFSNYYQGKTPDIVRVELETQVSPLGQKMNSLVIWDGVKRITFAPELTPVEKEWLVGEISDFLGYLSLLQQLERLI